MKGGVFMAKIDSAYAYYASTYADKEVSRYDSHKKSDLRKIYNRIIKTNKESPLYKISILGRFWTIARPYMEVETTDRFGCVYKQH